MDELFITPLVNIFNITAVILSAYLFLWMMVRKRPLPALPI
jgi:hypothetical protein